MALCRALQPPGPSWWGRGSPVGLVVRTFDAHVVGQWIWGTRSGAPWRWDSSLSVPLGIHHAR